MSTSLLPPTEEKKKNIPEKFLNKETGEINTENLLQSYLELEKKIGQKTNDIVLPQSPDEYEINVENSMFEADAELNKIFFEKGFTQDQVQFVYDLAAERLTPMILELAEDFQADREIEKLVDYFGGEDRFKEMSRQMLAWGKRNVKPEILQAMSSSFEGVVTLYKMMDNKEPKPVKDQAFDGVADEKDLQKMIADPRYWRDKDPSFVEKVTSEFQKFYAR